MGIIVDRDSHLTLTHQCRKILTEMINTGKYKHGDSLPTERMLAKQLGVSRITVREAIGYLVYRGLLVRRPGQGTFVTKPKLRMNNLTNYTRDFLNRGMKPSSKLLEMKLKSPSWELANFLMLSGSDRVIKLIRLRLADGEPVSIQTTYLPYSLCRDIYEKSLDWKTQSLAVALKDLGLIIVRAVQKISVTAANKREAELLKISPGAPLAVEERISYLDNDYPIEVLKSIYRGDRYNILVNLSAVTEDLL